MPKSAPPWVFWGADNIRGLSFKIGIRKTGGLWEGWKGMWWWCWRMQLLCLESNRIKGVLEVCSLPLVPVCVTLGPVQGFSFLLTLKWKLATDKCWHFFAETCWKRVVWQEVDCCLFSQLYFPPFSSCFNQYERSVYCLWIPPLNSSSCLGLSSGPSASPQPDGLGAFPRLAVYFPSCVW